MKNNNNILFIGILVLISNSKIFAGNLVGTSGLNYTTAHNVFRSGQSATGFVRMTNGFTVATPEFGLGSSHGSIAYLDTCLSVSGGIDLRTTNTIYLRADLTLDNGVTFSSGGSIYGNDRALILNGNLTIPANSSLHIGGKIIIEGNGNTLTLGNNSQLFIDADATLTLRNIIIKNTKNYLYDAPIKFATSGSQLALDNTILNFVNDFYFDRGSIFFHNDVIFTGTCAFIYKSCQPSFITNGTTLNFDVNTIFDFSPPTTGSPQFLAKDLLVMQDATSQLYLNCSTLKTTMTGLRLTKGEVLFDNSITITTAASLRVSGTTSTVIKQAFGTEVRHVAWSQDGRFLIVSGNNSTQDISIYRFNGTSLTYQNGIDYTTQGYCTSLSYDGKFLATGGNDTSTDLKIYNFPCSLGSLITSLGYTTSYPLTIAWHPNGKYLLVGGNEFATSVDLILYKFNGRILLQVDSENFATGPDCIDWHPSGNFVAVGPQSSTRDLTIFSFDEVNYLVEKTRMDLGAVATSGVKWRPDGNFIAITTNNATRGIVVYSFTGSTLFEVAYTSYGTGAQSLSWSPDGRYLAVAGTNVGAALTIYEFTGTNLNVLKQIPFCATAYAVAWHPNGRYIAVGGITPSTGNEELEVFEVAFGSELFNQAVSNSLIFGNSSLGSIYDLNVRALAGANIEYDGILNYDCVA
ncbi:MAG: hypothetical protein WCS92_00835 [Candidatus Babeliales bacterium]|jgi:WD40 repeat protein|nr:MAG: hypothetical protein US22_C0017G0002 [candidate division TM6 bacterium GW2011_GWF2_36_6]